MDKNKLVFSLKRHDSSSDNSLRAYNAADEYLLQEFITLDLKPRHLTLYNDRFGFLSCYLNAFNPTTIINYKSQEKAIKLNLESNELNSINFLSPISVLAEGTDFALVKLPKSLHLFEFFLKHICQNSNENVIILVGFMTRHFTPNLLEISNRYFESVTQSRALKKSRIVTLAKKKVIDITSNLNEVIYNNRVYKQFKGVFSVNHIDYATQFFLKHLDLTLKEKRVLDLASGNGIIAAEIQTNNPSIEMHLMDDSFLAVESAKMNLGGNSVFHHFNNDMLIFEDEYFDLIVTNPPFHFEYEININIPIKLFKSSFRCLKPSGSLWIVANKHLNYMTHLNRIFISVNVIAQNEKFIIYKCTK